MIGSIQIGVVSVGSTAGFMAVSECSVATAQLLAQAAAVQVTVNTSLASMVIQALEIACTQELGVNTANINISAVSVEGFQNTSYTDTALISVTALSVTTVQDGVSQVDTALIVNNNALPVSCEIIVSTDLCPIAITAKQVEAINYKYRIGIEL